MNTIEGKRAQRSLIEQNLNKINKKKLIHVKSGLALDQLPLLNIPGARPPQALAGGMVTSRAARVMLAGAGFLADAVSDTYHLHICNLRIHFCSFSV